MEKRRLLSIMLMVTVLLSISGCAKKEDESQNESDAYSESAGQVSPDVSASAESSTPHAEGERTDADSTSEASVYLKEVLASWNAERKDEAVEQFLSIRWADPSVFRDIQILNLSEKEFTSLPQAEMKRTLEDGMKLTGTLRKLMFHVVSVGEKLAASGDTKTAEVHFEAVRRYGEALSGPDRLEIIRLHGKAAAAYAQKRLSRTK